MKNLKTLHKYCRHFLGGSDSKKICCSKSIRYFASLSHFRGTAFHLITSLYMDLFLKYVCIISL